MRPLIAVLVTGGLIGFTQIASAEVYTPGR
jgi:hypothetical protein